MMVQIFTTTFESAATVMVSIGAWLLALLCMLGCLAILALVLARLFDLVTSLLAWLWQITGRKPKGRIARIIMRQRDDV